MMKIDNLLEECLSSYNRDLHFHKEPYDHICIENALTVERVKDIISSIEPHKNSLRKKDFNHEQGYFRTDYRLDIPDLLGRYNFLCDEFDAKWLKRDYLAPKNSIVEDKEAVYYYCCYGEYNNEIISMENVDSMENKNRIAACLPHFDQEAKIFIVLIYLCDDEEDNIGGDLELYTTDSSPIVRSFKKEDCNLEKTIKYSPGTVTIMMNSPKTIHAVGKRLQYDNSRKMIVITFESLFNWFDQRSINV